MTCSQTDLIYATSHAATASSGISAAAAYDLAGRDDLKRVALVHATRYLGMCADALGLELVSKRQPANPEDRTASGEMVPRPEQAEETCGFR